MSLIIQKYGGSSVASLERIQQVADKVIQAKKQGNKIVVTLSAMQGDTDHLIQIANSITHQPDPREYDALVSTGEIISITLLSMVLNARGHKARSYDGRQAGITTSSIHKKARIDTKYLEEALNTDFIPVVAGFQGVDPLGHVTTLGRGGSDTTAVALAVALKADECQIYTDVKGVYTTDPRVVSEARLLNRITFEEMLELASLGTKVLQIRSVEFAGKYNMPLRVLSSFEEGPGTLITYEDKRMEQPLVSGIAFDRNQAQLTIQQVPNMPGIAYAVFSALSDANIEVDMIVQNAANREGKTDFSFTVFRDDYQHAKNIIEEVAKKYDAYGVIGNDRIAKLSIVGVGMRSHAGVASTMFKALAEEGINIHLISTSEIKVSVVIDEKYLELGARTLHATFGLENHK